MVLTPILAAAAAASHPAWPPPITIMSALIKNIIYMYLYIREYMFIVVSPVDKWKKVYDARKTRELRGVSLVTKLVYKLCFESFKVLRK